MIFFGVNRFNSLIDNTKSLIVISAMFILFVVINKARRRRLYHGFSYLLKYKV